MRHRKTIHMDFVWTLFELCTMIPPVRTVPVWGRAQSSPVQMEGWTGLDHRLPVLDWTGSVWTSPHTYKFDSVSLSSITENMTPPHI